MKISIFIFFNYDWDAHIHLFFICKNICFFIKKDRGSSSGRIADYGVNPEASGASLKYTRDPHLYFTERHDDKSFGYEFDLKKEGDYVLILKFAEVILSI